MSGKKNWKWKANSTFLKASLIYLIRHGNDFQYWKRNPRKSI